jgi:hypothetical protein
MKYTLGNVVKTFLVRTFAGQNSRKFVKEALYMLIALELFLAYFYTLDLFTPSYVILLRGISWVKVYRLGLLDKGFYGLLPLLAISLTLGICAYTTGGFREIRASRLAGYVLASLTLVYCLPLIYWIAYMLDPLLLDQSLKPYRWISEPDAGLFHIYAPTYLLLLLVTLYAWLPQIIGGAFKGRIRLKIRCEKALYVAGNNHPLNSMLMEKLGFASALLLSIVLPLIPYLPTINPDFKPASVDIRYYSSWLDNMLKVDCWNAIEYAFYGVDNGNRPLYLILLYSLTRLGIPREFVLNFEALFLAPLFTLSTYFAAKSLSGSSSYASLASLAGVLGFNMTVGMFGGFFAAWAALSLFYTCIALTPSLMKRSLKGLMGCILASIVMLYTHPWTWCLLICILTIYLTVSTFETLKSSRFKINTYILTVLIINATVELIKNMVTPRYGGLESSVQALSKNIELGLDQLMGFRSINRISTTYLGGLLYNPLHILLALIGIISFLKKKDKNSKLILIWTATISTLFLFGTLAFKARLLLFAPFPLLIAEGLWALSRLLARFDSKLPKLLYTFFITSSLTYTVRALCNLI